MLLEEVIVGSCVHALVKAYSESVPIILVDQSEPDVDVVFDHPVRVETLNTTEVVDAWSMLKFLCSMRGLVINPDTLDFLRMEKNNIGFRDTSIEFKKCHLFPSQNIRTDLDIHKAEHEDLYSGIRTSTPNFDYSDTIVRFVSQKELLKDERLHRPITRGESRRNPNLEVIERRVTPLEEVVYRSNEKVEYYDRQKRDDILKAYRRDNSSI